MIFKTDNLEVGFDSETKQWLVSDSYTLVYGAGQSFNEAFEDYVISLGEYHTYLNECNDLGPSLTKIRDIINSKVVENE